MNSSKSQGKEYGIISHIIIGLWCEDVTSEQFQNVMATARKVKSQLRFSAREGISVTPQLQHVWGPVARVSMTQIAGPRATVSDSVGLRWTLKFVLPTSSKVILMPLGQVPNFGSPTSSSSSMLTNCVTWILLSCVTYLIASAVISSFLLEWDLLYLQHGWRFSDSRDLWTWTNSAHRIKIYCWPIPRKIWCLSGVMRVAGPSAAGLRVHSQGSTGSSPNPTGLGPCFILIKHMLTAVPSISLCRSQLPSGWAS